VPHALVDLLTVAALAALLAVAFWHPRPGVEVLAALVAAAVVLASGAVEPAGALDEVRLLLPVVAFLSAILVVSEVCAAEGLFTAVGATVARLGRDRPRRMLALTFAAAAVTTAVLSLDATVVLLTPVVAAAATGTATSSRPLVHACARLANTASVLLHVSNLTNLLALPSLPGVSFLGFAAVMAPVWLAVIGVEYVGHRVFFARELTAPRPTSHDGRRTEDRALPVVPLVVVALMLVGFAALSPLGVEPAWVSATAAVVLAGHATSRRAMRVGEVLRSAHASFAIFVVCLGIVVAGLSATFLGALVAAAVPDGTGLVSLLTIALLATVLANLVNNLPATLLLVPLVAPLGVTAVLAALVGLGVGAGLTYAGSLANLLWRRALVRRGTPPSGQDFHLLSALVTLPAVGVGTVVLWAWAPLVR